MEFITIKTTKNSTDVKINISKKVKVYLIQNGLCSYKMVYAVTNCIILNRLTLYL